MQIKIITQQINHRPVYMAIIEHDSKVYTQSGLTLKELFTNITNQFKNQ